MTDGYESAAETAATTSAATGKLKAPRGLGRLRLSSVFATVSVMTLVTLGLAVHAGSATAAGPSVSIEQVRVITDYTVMAVDTTGVTYGTPVSDDTGIWRSLDQGATWTEMLPFPANNHVTSISTLASGTVLAHVDIGSLTLFRSNDHGLTWAPVLALPTDPVFNTTLTSSSVADGDGHVWIGTYNTDAGVNQTYENQIFRSDDDGVTWASVNTTTTHRHIHGLRYNTTNHRLYVFFGDSPGDGIWQSADNGVTLQPLCTEYECVTIDGAFGEDSSGGFIVFGQDNYTHQNRIVKVSLATGALTNVLDIPYDSFSTYRLNSSTYLVGTSHEGPDVPIVDPNLHLYISTDGATSFVDVLQVPIPYPNGRADLMVQSSYPNGDFPIQIDGYGTIIARIATEPAPPGDDGGSTGGGGGGGGGLAADLALTGSATPASAPAGGSIAWRLQVQNKNLGSAAGVYVDVQLPAGVSLLSSSADRGAGCSGTTVLRCNLDFLSGTAPNANIVLVTNVTGPGELVLSATTGYSGTDPNAGDNSLVLRANTPTTGTLPTSLPRTPAVSAGVTRTGTAKANVLIGTRFADLLRGLGGNDRVIGLAGNDKLYGGTGNDTLTGGLGKDVIEGGTGADTINARDGQRDTIRCGAGYDTVIADRVDAISGDCDRVKRR